MNYCNCCQLPKAQTCRTCKTEKSTDCFDKGRKTCKQCRKKYNAEKYLARKVVKAKLEVIPEEIAEIKSDIFLT